jgi:Protein of unknown function (DUF4239)
MNSLAVGAISFCCILVGALLGRLSRWIVPDHHLAPDSKDVVKLCAGLIATMAALVLGLMVSSAKSSYDAVNDGLVRAAVTAAETDRILAQYGPEAKPARDQVRHNLASIIDAIWPETSAQKFLVSEAGASEEGDLLGDMLRKLNPQDESQRILKAAALQAYNDGMKLRWLLVEQAQASIPTVFLVVLVFWFTVLFAIFSMLTPGNSTVNVVMVFCALTITGGIVLVLDMNRPFEGILKVSSAPMKNVLVHLGR